MWSKLVPAAGKYAQIEWVAAAYDWVDICCCDFYPNTEQARRNNHHDLGTKPLDNS